MTPLHALQSQSLLQLHRQQNAALPQPTRLRNRCRAAAVAQNDDPCAARDVRQDFENLVSLLSPGCPVRSDYTALGRGLVANQDLAAGTNCVTVDVFNLLCITDEPLKTNAFGTSALSDWQLLHGELPPLLSSYLLSSRGDWFKRLVTWLLWLKRHATGIWPLYMQLLPLESEMTSLMNFTPEERQEMQFPDMIQLAEKERTAIQGLHDAVFSSHTGELAALDLAPDFQDTLWAACMVNSRCFSDNVGREALSLLVPCADMANHSLQPNAAYKLDPDSQSFNIYTTQDVPAGSEVLISYLGYKPTKDNNMLMKDYGFVLPGNVNDTIQFQHTGSNQPLFSAAKLLDAAAQLPAPEAAHSSSGSNSSSEANSTHRRRQQAVMKSLKPFVALGQRDITATADGKGKQLAMDLAQQCQQQIDGCCSSIQEDEQLLSSGQQPVRTQAAVLARLERKRLLLTAQQLLQQYAHMV